ncbi:unnamed protein product [Effrenium voratum]|uniref:Prolyl 4-hydroxylase alpha subunit domain-containing protein n=1 Tax=Effrenium voratum TaxID=2562239 RepID=A0AA36JKU8_9DINO|nr:unnamed protein product [Effrenium voratum]CAJ1421037.1 unnamed protein product [Effrenium voratum]
MSAKGQSAAVRWLDSVASGARLRTLRRELRRQLAAKGFAKLPELLPEHVAEAVRQALKVLDWEQAGEGARDDAGYEDQVQHHFSIADVEGDVVLLGAARFLARLLPGTLPNFSAACYRGRDHIAPHTDLVPETYSMEEVKQEWPGNEPQLHSCVCQLSCQLRRAYGRGDLASAAQGWRRWRESRAETENLQDALQSDDLAAVRRAVEQGARAPSVPFRRWVAAAYYLNKDWKPSFGGQFVDLESEEGAAKHSPDFNTLVAFEVPRLHEVSAVRKGHARYSLFGWWLVEDAPHAPHAQSLKRPAAKAEAKTKRRKTAK